jgi:hypothetical protein
MGARAQENSPYSRFGIGDLLSQQNILNRAMGGVAIPYNDLQSVNFANPASYAYLKVTTLDIGVDITSRTLVSGDPQEKFNSKYLIPSYVQIGLPLKKKGFWGMNIGFRPVSRINYDLETRTRLPGIDSVLYNYIGNGGAYQAYLGTGFGNRKISFGINAGYLWGNKNYSTRLVFINDTIPYRKSNSTDSLNFGGIFVQAGALYRAELGRGRFLRLGASGSLQNSLKATRDVVRETFDFDANAGISVLDSVYRSADESGEIIFPASVGFGVMLEKEDKWLLGVEFNQTFWADYRSYGAPDDLRNKWTIRVGGQMLPDANGKSLWSRVVYRAGFSYGPEYIDLPNPLNQYLISFGASFPVRRSYYTNQYTSINTAFEIGQRGNKDNSLRENFWRLSVGFNLSDIWFNPRKYD